MSKAQIVDHVWEYDFDGNYGIVETYVSYLRRKLDDADGSLIQTVRGVGYVIRPSLMTLRTKLVISFTLLLLAVIAAVGLVASRSIRSILIGQIDQELQGVVSRGPGPYGDGPARARPRRRPVPRAVSPSW